MKYISLILLHFKYLFIKGGNFYRLLKAIITNINVFLKVFEKKMKEFLRQQM